MFNIVLFQPEIPPNTGNVIRLCANTGCNLHLIEPFGFHWDSKALHRAGLDYHELTRVTRHRSWSEWKQRYPQARTTAFTTKGITTYTEYEFRVDDFLLFGPETRGLPKDILDEFDDGSRLRIPMISQSRSLNLSNSVAVAVYEAWRQVGF